MTFFQTVISKLLAFEKEPQKVGLSQLNHVKTIEQPKVSLKNKDVKLSDLMRRAG